MPVAALFTVRTLTPVNVHFAVIQLPLMLALMSFQVRIECNVDYTAFCCVDFARTDPRSGIFLLFVENCRD